MAAERKLKMDEIGSKKIFTQLFLQLWLHLSLSGTSCPHTHTLACKLTHEHTEGQTGSGAAHCPNRQIKLLTSAEVVKWEGGLNNGKM